MKAKEQKESRVKFNRALSFIIKNLDLLDDVIVLLVNLKDKTSKISNLSIEATVDEEPVEVKINPNRLTPFLSSIIIFILSLGDLKKKVNEKESRKKDIETAGRLSNEVSK